MLRASLVGVLAIALAATALGAPSQAKWHTNLDEARTEAWERGVPMLIFLSRFT